MDEVPHEIDEKMQRLQSQILWDEVQYELGRFKLEDLENELAAITRRLDRNYTYLLPVTRIRLKARARWLTEEIPRYSAELEAIRQRFAGFTRVVVDTHQASRRVGS
jgi:hypothetical protein